MMLPKILICLLKMIVLKDVAKDTDLFIKDDCFEDVAKDTDLFIKNDCFERCCQIYWSVY